MKYAIDYKNTKEGQWYRAYGFIITDKPLKKGEKNPHYEAIKKSLKWTFPDYQYRIVEVKE